MAKYRMFDGCDTKEVRGPHGKGGSRNGLCNVCRYSERG